MVDKIIQSKMIQFQAKFHSEKKIIIFLLKMFHLRANRDRQFKEKTIKSVGRKSSDGCIMKQAGRQKGSKMEARGF